MQLILEAAGSGFTAACTQLGGLHPSARNRMVGVKMKAAPYRLIQMTCTHSQATPPHSSSYKLKLLTSAIFKCNRNEKDVMTDTFTLDREQYENTFSSIKQY